MNTKQTKRYPRHCLVLIILLSLVGNALAERAKRPMVIHKLPELGLEIWTEYDPLWVTELHHQGNKPLFTAQTPALVYPPAAMKIVSFPGMRLSGDELQATAKTAIRSGAKNYRVDPATLQNIQPTPATYGDLQGYQADFSGKAHGDQVDVKVFLGHQPGKGPVMLQIHTLKGKLTHLSEQIRRSWGNIKYLD